MQPKKSVIIEVLGTPEAGKTSLISDLKPEYEKIRKTEIVVESAEVLPKGFEKGSMEAHYWMRMNTVKNLLEKQFCSPNTTILVDRGIVDALFWEYYLLNVKKRNAKQFQANTMFFNNLGIKSPDLVIYLTTTPEEAIRRIGGEGTLVTKDFVKEFNLCLEEFMKSISTPVLRIDTTKLSKQQVCNYVLKKTKTLI